MGEMADDLIDAGFGSEYEGEPGDHFWCGPPQPRKPLCTNSDIHHIVGNIIARKAQKPISRDVLDKHVTEIAKIRFNPNTDPRDIEQTIDELLDKVVGFKTRHNPDIYRQIALCAILLADAAESGKW